MASLMDQARAQRAEQPAQDGQLQVPDWREYTPPEMHDAVERIIAAGAKLMYSPELREELVQAVQSDVPVDQKLADNVVGLTLTMDKQANGAMPVAALFPAGIGLLGEAANVLQAAGQPVTQENFNDAILRMYVLMGKKLGGTDEQIMQGAQQAMGGQAGAGSPAEGQPPAGQPAPAAAAGGAPGGEPSGMPPQASVPPEDDEMAGMERGMA